jgi:hypothetical protein
MLAGQVLLRVYREKIARISQLNMLTYQPISGFHFIKIHFCKNATQNLQNKFETPF